MMMAVRESKKYLPADYKPDPDGEFKPVIVNSVVFLVSAVQQVREPTAWIRIRVIALRIPEAATSPPPPLPALPSR